MIKLINFSRTNWANQRRIQRKIKICEDFLRKSTKNLIWLNYSIQVHNGTDKNRWDNGTLYCVNWNAEVLSIDNFELIYVQMLTLG